VKDFGYTCGGVRALFSAYLDGDVPGTTMQAIEGHLQGCPGCAADFVAWKKTQQMLTSLRRREMPEDLGLKLRIAVSRERSRTTQESLGRWQVRWQNTLRPVALRVSAGLASAVFLVGTFALLIGMFATPQPVEARDVPLNIASAPRLLYSAVASDMSPSSNPLIVEVFVDREGKVYDYRILAGDDDPATRAQVENVLLFSVFAPARSFDQPVRGTALMSFSGVSVRG
jgi:anti-sigma factor RsiW